MLPQRIARGLVDIGGMDLVERRHGIEEPDLVMRLVVLDVGEMRVARRVVEVDIGFGVARGEHRVLEVQALGILACRASHSRNCRCR